MSGRFQRADQHALAEANRSAASREYLKFEDQIEVLMPEAIKLDRSVVRLDAIYRAAHRALRTPDKIWADMRALFADVSARSPAAPAASADRMGALVRLCRLASRRPGLPRDLGEAYESFLAFETSEDASTLASSTLEPEDDAALGDSTFSGVSAPSVR